MTHIVKWCPSTVYLSLGEKPKQRTCTSTPVFKGSAPNSQAIYLWRPRLSLNSCCPDILHFTVEEGGDGLSPAGFGQRNGDTLLCPLVAPQQKRKRWDQLNLAGLGSASTGTSSRVRNSAIKFTAIKSLGEGAWVRLLGPTVKHPDFQLIWERKIKWFDPILERLWHPFPGSSPAVISYCTEKDVGDGCLCFIFPPSHGWTGETWHGRGTLALKGRVGQAECGLYRAAIADTGAEWAQNISDKLLFASVQTILLLKVHLAAFFSRSRHNDAQGSAV